MRWTVSAESIRRLVRHNERVARSKLRITVLFDTDKRIYNSGTTAAQWSYCHARLKCGLVKGKYVDAVFGSKTALEWMKRSGTADQSMMSRRRGYRKTNARLILHTYAGLA